MINKRDTPTIYLIQETWISKEDDRTNIDDILFISHGYKKEPNEIQSANGGVCIVLSKVAQKVWKRAGQPDAITSRKVAKIARNVGLELHFLDSEKKIIKLFVIPTYLPCSMYSDGDFDKTLEPLQNIINKCPKDTIPIISGGFNASIGVDKDNDNNGITGEFGNSHQNDRGDTLRFI